MKINPWLFSAAALLITGGWLIHKRNSAATLEHEISALRERIRLVGASSDGDGPAGSPEEDLTINKDGSINWKGVATRIAHFPGGSLPDARLIRIRRMLLGMTADELEVELDRIGGIVLDPFIGAQFETMIVDILEDKDPRRVVERVDRFGNEASGGFWRIRSAFGKWAAMEPAAAASWLDSQIAAGKLESKSLAGKSLSHIGLETSLVLALLAADPAAAAARLTALPEDCRADFFGEPHHFELSAKGQAAYAELIRNNLSPGQASHTLINVAAGLSLSGGYDRVSGFIADANATDEEKAGIVRQVIERQLTHDVSIRTVTIEDLDRAHAWGEGHAPGVADAAMGEMLGERVGLGVDFTKVSKPLLQYHARTGDDTMLAGFLRSDAVREQAADKAAELINLIKDPALRAEISALPQYSNPPTP